MSHRACASQRSTGERDWSKHSKPCCWISTTHWSVVLTRKANQQRLRRRWKSFAEPIGGRFMASSDAKAINRRMRRISLKLFLRGCSNGRDLETVRQERGRLRSYLLASLKNFLSKARHRELAIKRGEGRPGFAGRFARARTHRPGAGPQIERGSHLRASLGINIIGASAHAAQSRI